MGQKEQQQEQRRSSLRGLFDKVLDILEGEIQKLPDTLSQATPERRLDFISKNLPLLLKYKQSGEGDSWTDSWGE